MVKSALLQAIIKTPLVHTCTPTIRWAIGCLS